MTSALLHHWQQQVPTIEVQHPKGRAIISLFGGHVLSFIPAKDGRERLYVSPQANFDGKQAIRGGIPVCWPWFSDRHGQALGSLPAHGYLRKQLWQLADSQFNDEAHQVRLVPRTTQGDGFDGQADVSLLIEVGSRLSVCLTTHNTGSTAFTFTCALHSYFAVQDIQQAELNGLSGQFEDKTRHFQLSDTPSPYHFSGETDRVHLSRAACVTLHDGNVYGNAHTDIHSQGHDSIVVWNPWEANCQTMADMPDDGYLQMLCVETAVTQGVTLAAGEQHQLRQIID